MKANLFCCLVGLAHLSWPVITGAAETSERKVAVRDVVTTNYLPMRRHVSSHPPMGHSVLNRRGVGSANLTNFLDVYYIVDLVLGNQSIPVSIDTGSSDTWVVKEPYDCVSFWVPFPGAVSFVLFSFGFPV